MQKTCTNQRRMTQWYHCFGMLCHEAEESDNSKINTEWHEVSVDLNLTTLTTVVMSSSVSNIVINIGLHLPAFS